MSSVIRPSFEVVKERRILNKIKHLQPLIVGVFYLVPVWCQDLEENNCFDIMSGKSFK
jgi:hypothetical protein